MPTPREEMLVVARRMERIAVPFAFLGGAVMWVLVDHPELTQFRRTKDVDVVVAVVTYHQFAALEERLRRAGFQHDVSPGAPIFRWIVEGCRVDIMPQAPANLGMNTRWFPEALSLSIPHPLGDGCVANVVSPPLFLATKLEAFNDRGKSDYYASHDLEDIVTLVDGRAAIAQDVASAAANIRRFISSEFAKITTHPDFSDALHGHMTERERIPLVRNRFTTIAGLS